MFIEKVITYVVRNQSEKYLHFNPKAPCSLPPRKNHSAPLLLYLHVPFCEELCTYCSFHRVRFRESQARVYFAALRKEILLYKSEGYDFRAMYIGGGTPTVLIDELVETIALAKECFAIKEISVETNPNHLDRETMIRLKEVGVERLSVGVQSFNDAILQATDRYHKYGSSAQIIQRIKDMQGLFKTINIDMIFNFPNQTEQILQQDITTILDLKIDQVTFYPLMVSTSTHKEIEKKMGKVQNWRDQRFYEIICQALAKEYQASTAWCFSRNESLLDEYVVNYEEYAGLGSGAFGYLNGSVYANQFDIPEYIKQVGQGRYPIAARRDCQGPSAILYDFMMQFFSLSIPVSPKRKKYGFYAQVQLGMVLLFFWLIGSLEKDSVKDRFVIKKPYHGVIMMREFFIAVNDFRDYCRSRTNKGPEIEPLLEKTV